MKKTIIALGILISFPLLSSAWWQTGHMIVAEIAYQNLTITAKQKVEALLPNMAAESTSTENYDYNASHPNWSWMAAAHWPDDVAYKTGRLKIYAQWHYINLPFSGDGTKITNTVKSENIVWVIPLLKEALAYEEGNA